MADRLLLRGGSIVTVDPEIGDLPKGDILIEGDTIAAVAPSIEADAEVIDAEGMVVIPGFVDTHRHTWEAAIRNCAPNAIWRCIRSNANWRQRSLRRPVRFTRSCPSRRATR